MKFKFFTPVLLTTLAFSGAVAFQPQVQAKPANSNNQSTVFRCVRSGSGFATVAERGGRRSAPMITWQRYVSAEYTPEARCNSVSQKLTNAVAQNGGSLRNLLLTSGRVNSETVICYVNSGARCNTSNTLFTLSRENASDPGSVLASLLRFGAGASGGPVPESANGGEDTPTEVNMEAAVDEAFSAGTYESAGGSEPDSAPSPNPSESAGGNENTPSAEPSEVPTSETGGNQGGF
jgi:hypothetical protein